MHKLSYNIFGTFGKKSHPNQSKNENYQPLFSYFNPKQNVLNR